MTAVEGLTDSARIRELTYANEQRRLVIDALERKLAEAQALALANGMRADAAERRIAAALQWEDDGLEGDALIYHMLEELRGE